MFGEFIVELIGTIISEFIFQFLIKKIFSLPGAFIHWMSTGFSKSFSEIYKKNVFTNVLVTIIAILIIALLNLQLFH